MKQTRVISMILAVLLALSTLMLLTGCGDKEKEKDKIYETIGSKEKETEKPTQPATQAGTGTSATQVPYNGGGNSSGNDAVETFGADNPYSYDEAIQSALDQAGDGAQVMYSEEDGAGNWLVTIARADGSTVTYHSGYQFCYPVEGSDTGDDDDDADDDDSDADGINDAYYADVSEQAAGQTALDQMGEGWMIISSSQGSYEGVEAWVVTMTNEEGQTVRAYVNGDSCNFG